MATVNYTLGEKFITLSAEDIMQRLGNQATEADADLFARVWNTRFFDSDGKPEFDDTDDLDPSWEETVELMSQFNQPA